MWKYAISHFRWDDFIRNIICRDKTTLNPIDLTGSIIKFSIKRLETDTDFIYTGVAIVINAIWWVVQIDIPNTVTVSWQPQSCYYDIQITDSNWIVSTIIKDTFTIIYNIT